MAVDAFLRGLPPGNLRVHTQLQKCATLSAAMDFAIHYEHAEAESGLARKPVARALLAVETAAEETLPAPSDETVAIARAAQSSPTLARKPTPTTTSPSNESSAANGGPWSAEAYERLLAKVDALTNQRERRRTSACFNCRQEGHFARECPQKTTDQPASKNKSRSRKAPGNE